MSRASPITEAQKATFAALYRSGAPRSVWRERIPGVTDGQFNGLITRMRLHRPPTPGAVSGLKSDHPAVVDGHALFRGRVRDPGEAPVLLMPGYWQSKLGSLVSKGHHTGSVIYSLTLEERATCPRSCHNWNSCFGNGMHFAWRNRAGPELERLLEAELGVLQRRHPRGFLVRLHVLGDFPTVGYVERWARWLDQFPALRVFGYTAWPAGSAIGDAVMELSDRRWSRFAIRRSTTEPGTARAITMSHMPDGGEAARGVLVCPMQLGRARDCASCGLCWAPAAWGKTIAFLAHGQRGGRKKKIGS